MHKAISVLILVVLFVIAGWTHAAAMDKMPGRESNAAVLFMPAPSSLKLISLGYDSLVADCLWLQFIQYIGTKGGPAPNTSGVAAEMLDAITTLDPHISQAYFFIATIIGDELHDPVRADRLLQRGISANPDNWYLPFIAGINEYLFAHDELRAAKYYRIASHFSSAPSWLARQAEILEANIPSTIKRINIWQKVFETSHEPAVNLRARQELCALWVHVRDHAAVGSLVRNRADVELVKLGVSIFKVQNGADFNR